MQHHKSVALRNKAIDGMRAFAIAAVLAVHFVPAHFLGGGIGVDVFFVISGFVITASLKGEWEREHSISLKRFYIRRIRRLWPALWLLAGFVAVLGPRFDPAAPLNVAFAMTGTMNWARAISNDLGGSLGHAWSLGIEEQFYLLWPPALVLILRRRLNPAATIGAVLVAVNIWTAWVVAHPPTPLYAYYDLFCRSSGLLLGCLIALTDWYGPEWFRRLWIVPFLALTAIVVMGLSPVAAASPLVSLLSAWLVCACAGPEGILHRILAWQPIQWLGLRSYSLYLWHYPLLAYLGFLPVSNHVRFLIVLAATGAAAELSYRFVEQRLRVKREVSGFAPPEASAVSVAP